MKSGTAPPELCQTATLSQIPHERYTEGTTWTHYCWYLRADVPNDEALDWDAVRTLLDRHVTQLIDDLLDAEQREETLGERILKRLQGVQRVHSTHDPDEALASAAAAATSADRRRCDEETQRDQLVAAYLADREVLRDQLARTGERVLELLLKAPGNGGLQSIVVEERSFGRKTRLDGWPLAGSTLLRPSGEVVYYHTGSGHRLRIQGQSTLTEWVEGQLSRAKGRLGDRPPGEQYFLAKSSMGTTPGFEKQLRESWRAIESDIMARYVQLLEVAGVRPDSEI